MATNFGCGERRHTMASQPSVYNEERNLLRLRAWEQRNQETSQSQDLNPENVPLFGEPYKTNKEDELSNRIQKMLGSYEDVNNPSPFSSMALPISSCVSFLQSDQGQPNTDESSNAPFHHQAPYLSSQSQKRHSSDGQSSQPTKISTATSASNHHTHSSTFSKTFLNHSKGSQFSHSAHQQKKSKVFSDLREHVTLAQEISAQSPDSKQLPLLHSSDHNIDMDTRDSFSGHQLQGSTDCLLGFASTMDVSTLNIKQSPEDASLPQAKTNSLPSQTFPSLLSSKQPGTVMPQKPTAYVRPMDGQDQVVNESPELKPSPEHYAALPELINKSDLGKTKIMPQFLETTAEEAQCVEDILREMTHSWPPLLTAIHTPISDEPKFLFPAREAEHVSSRPEQKNHGSFPAAPSHFSQQSSSISFEAHSSGVETTSSSDSESSPGSESDSESTIDEPPQPPNGSSVKTEPDAPAVSHGDWQLGNWIKSNQQNSGADIQGSALVSESPTHEQLPPTQSSEHTTKEYKPQLSSHRKEFADDLAAPQKFSESSQDNCCQQQSSNVSTCSNSRKTTKSTTADSLGPTEAALGVKCEEVVTTQTKDFCFTDRPKVKMKAVRFKKASNDTKRDNKLTKNTKLDKQRAGSEATLVLHSHCQSCGEHYPNPCSCPTQSPALPDQPSPAPPLRGSHGKPRAKTGCQSGTKQPHKLIHKHSESPGHAAKGSLDLHLPPTSLLVKIDLNLLSRVPQASSIHRGIPSKTKRPALVLEKDEERSNASKTQKYTTPSEKSQNIKVENKSLPKKKPKLENKMTPSAGASGKLHSSSNSTQVRKQKKAHKQIQNSTASKDSAKESKLQKSGVKKPQEAGTSEESCKSKKSSGKHTQQPRHGKQRPPKTSTAVPAASQPLRKASTSRPLLRFDEREYPVKHYIKEAKRLKHKADAESDKLSKALNYLDAAMFFVESGIAMEKDPQISTSSYTMFAETVELLKFILKLKNPVDSTATPSEKDLLALCLKCQSLLQMAMFSHKHKMALKYSKTLTDHFNTSPHASHNPLCSSKTAENPPLDMPSPASTSTSSGPGSNHSGLGMGSVGPAVAFPKEIEQVAFTYVNITMLFLSAHDIWEQAEELVHKGNGMLTELDTVMGPLSLTSSMSSMVRYTRQGVHWLRLDSQKV
ncbi:LOW QUALITY PROTEIN: AF4/FMR2 family member 1 [Melanotaenia boesemani]|uniref:LOW QUALITY PROTEIN: AF4/FMR2 family member 1 n=1 Tax=Melanotaenia boesemani TaxID=1250792 RepID=UPI001C043574|nr:LOW QUALITY PROTEIN: AF4/FMR2 family member 1 [Melanotaenia boesemani]